MAEEYSRAIYAAVKNYLDAEDYNYEWNTDRNWFRFNMKLNGKVPRALCTIQIRSDAFLMIARTEVAAGEADRGRVAEYLCRANYGLVQGCFEMDFNDGEIRYRTYTHCGSLIPERETIERGILIALAMLQRYGDGLVAVMFDVQSPEEACRQAEAQ